MISNNVKVGDMIFTIVDDDERWTEIMTEGLDVMQVNTNSVIAEGTWDMDGNSYQTEVTFDDPKYFKTEEEASNILEDKIAYYQWKLECAKYDKNRK